MALRTGLSVPFGNATAESGDSLRRRYSVQWPLLFEIGAKPGDSVFIGGYFGFSFGAEGSDARIEGFCEDDDGDAENEIVCSTVGFRLGLELIYGFSPGDRVNPWLGYGIGWESQRQTINDRITRREEETTSSGLELARIMFGLDVRYKTLGFGPVIEAALGRYTTSETAVNGDVTFDGDVERPSLHGWLTLGIRGVVFP
jgi:hypothetical protein